MNLADYKTYCDELMNREELGSPASPDSFNTFIKLSVNEFYKEQYRLFMKMWGQMNGGHLPYYQTAISKLLASDAVTHDDGSGVISLPSDFKYPITAAMYMDAMYVDANIVSPDQLNNIALNDLQDAEEYPIVLLSDQTAEGIPTTFTKIRFRYFKKITDPVYDYCVDTNNRVIYMPPGYQLVDNGGTTELHDGDSNVIKSGVSHVDDPTLPYDSQSVEVVFDDDYFDEIANKVVELMSVKTREAGVMQYAQNEQQ